MKPGPVLGATAVAAVIVAGALFYLQNFNAAEIACEDIPAARVSLQAQYDAGVEASVTLYREARADAEARLSSCLRAEPKDPCAAEQGARDQAYKNFFAIPSPADDAPYAEFQDYYQKRDDAYNAYKTAKAALDQCRANNPPKPDVPYEESDTKACFDEYDKADKAAQDKFSSDTLTMRAALKAALAALDEREKACHPPQDDDRFSLTPGTGQNAEDYSENIVSCRPIDPNADPELARHRARKAEIAAEIQSIDTTLENAGKSANKVRVDISGVDTYIPPESSNTQFEGALNALRGQRKAQLESSLDYYKRLIERKQNEKTQLQNEMRDVDAQIAARQNEIQRENNARKQKYPTTVHLAGPDECAYYHCHGVLCGIPDPKPNGCGHGSTSEGDIDCKAFIDAYIQAGSGK